MVTETMDDARRIAFGGSTRCRVVTLSGEIINPSGEMQGFAKPRRGIMTIEAEKKPSFAPEDIDLMHQNIKDSNNKLNNMAAEIKVLQSAMAAELKQKQQFMHHLQIVQSEVEGLRQRLNQLINRQKELQELNCDDQEKELEDLKRLEEVNQKALAKIQILIDAKARDIAEIERQIDEVGGEEFKAIKLKRQHLSEAEEHLENEVNK